MKPTLYILTLALTLASCGSSRTDEPTPVVPATEGYAMAFTTPTEAQSRDATADDVAAALGNQFAIVVRKTNSAGLNEYVLSKDSEGNSPYIVSYTHDDGWDYTGPADQHLKFWDLTASDHTFYAIANCPPPITFSHGYVSITDIAASSAYADLMESHYCRRDPEDPYDFDLLGPQTAVNHRPTTQGDVPAYADVVPLPFHRLLSQVQFKIYNKSYEGGDDITISNVKIQSLSSIYTTGNYLNCGFEYNGTHKRTTEIADCDLTPGTIMGNTKDTATLLYSGPVLPQACDYNATVTITTDAGVIAGKIALGPSWDKGKIYTYILIIDVDNSVILVENVTIDPWVPYKTIDNTQTNW